MNASDALFELIKSLTKSEKGYFKKFSSLNTIDGKNNYVKLFDAIAQQRQYDEKKLVKLFEKEKFSKQFSVTKHYLYNLILRSMESYRYHQDADTELYSLLHHIKILDEKGLHSQCKKVIEKAIALAVKYDLQLPLLRLMEWEVSIIKTHSFIGENGNTMRELFSKIFRSVEQYKLSTQYYFTNTLLLLKEIKMGAVRKQSDREELKKIMEETPPHTHLISPEYSGRVGLQGWGWTAIYRYYLTKGHSFWLLNDYENAYSQFTKAIQLLETNPHQIKEKPLNYIGAMRNLYLNGMYLKKYKECTAIIEKLKTLQVKSSKIKGRIDALTNEMSVWLCIETGAFNEGIELIKSRGDNTMVLLKGEIPIAQYNIAYLYFGTENYRKANEYLNKILNEAIDIRNDAQCFARIFSLIVHFEMGKHDLLEYTVKSTYRFLYKRDKLYKVEKIILDFIQKELLEIHSQKELLVSFEVLLTKMKSLSSDPFERRAFECFDFVSWLESKIEGRAFAEVVREKVEKIL